MFQKPLGQIQMHSRGERHVAWHFTLGGSVALGGLTCVHPLELISDFLRTLPDCPGVVNASEEPAPVSSRPGHVRLLVNSTMALCLTRPRHLHQVLLQKPQGESWGQASVSRELQALFAWKSICFQHTPSRASADAGGKPACHAAHIVLQCKASLSVQGARQQHP